MKKLLWGMILVLGLGGVGFWAVRRGLIKPLEVSYIFNEPGKTVKDTSAQTREMVSKIKEATGKATGNYTFWVWRYADNVSYGLGEDDLMPLASMMKVPIMVATLQAVDAGKLSLDEIYTIKPEDVRDGSSFGAGDKLDVRKMLSETGINSDNITPVALVNMVGDAAIRKALTDLGMSEKVWDTKEASAREVGEMWKILYEKNILSPDSKAILREDLTESIYEDRIAKGVTDKNTTLIHKVGTDQDVWADSGMVLDSNNTPLLVMVIMDKGVDRQESADLVPQIAGMIWNYENLKDQAADPS
jgi:beta-lactamase class A